MEFFRFHPNASNLILIDASRVFQALCKDKTIDRKKLNLRLFEICGFAPTDFVAQKREPKPIGHFHAPDSVKSTGHVVIHPFGRAWGQWPQATCDVVRTVLSQMPVPAQVFVISATYITSDGRHMRESFPCNLPNVTVLQNLSAPAAFSLVASASRFIGNLSSLAQVAAFERVPSLILYPERCSDYKPPYSAYAKRVWNANGIGICHETIEPWVLGETLRDFLWDCRQWLDVKQTFAKRFPVPELT